MTSPKSYEELCALATANDDRFENEPYVPYEYQSAIAQNGFPELLEVPTGCGKTFAMILAWIWRRRFHHDPDVRHTTPRRLVYVLPQRVLVEQVAKEVRAILKKLDLLDEVGLAVLMGGEGGTSNDWRLRPEGDAILVATQDMALSAAVNRRYGISRWSWPIEFGLLNNDCHYVYDEIQLMGPGLPTSRQLDGLRQILGTALPCGSTWMSATVEVDQLATVDCPTISTHESLSDADRSGHLSKRLHAARTIREIAVVSPKSYAKDIAASLVEAHKPGTRTIAVFNTVARAVDAYKEIKKLTNGPEIVLIHSRFRPDDRQRHLDQALKKPDSNAVGTIVITTQVLEAGVDITSEMLFTEAAPWSSVVQRAGRCNRDGKADNPQLLWTAPPSAAPYNEDEVKASRAALTDLEGQTLSTEALVNKAPESAATPVIHQVLRRKDLIELFDTLPDLSGSDIDVSRFIRDADERDVTVAWVPFTDHKPDLGQKLPPASARCSVPISDAKALIALRPWRFDHLKVSITSQTSTTESKPNEKRKTDGSWVICQASDLRPGMTVILDAQTGGYDPEYGWAPKSKAAVEPIDDSLPTLGNTTDPNIDTGIGSDSLSVNRSAWVGLKQHLADVEVEATKIDQAIAPSGLSSEQRQAAIIAARLHDLGKAHEVFQTTLNNTASSDEESTEASQNGPPWAKSGGSAKSRHSRPFFRHELASALALLDDGQVVLDGEAEKDLIIYLVAAHHGRIRLGLRSLPGEYTPSGELANRAVALGIISGEMLPAVEVPGATVPASMLNLSVMQLGRDATGQPSWAQRMLPLRDRADLGPFRLGYLEAIVRMADWRASASPGASTQEDELEAS